MNQFLIFLAAITVFLSSCKKEPARYCWQMMDNLGNELNIICDKTESELIECTKNQTCGINYGFTITKCNYYIIDKEKFCCLINGDYYEDVTENKLALYRNCFGVSGAVERVACGYCAFWYSREKGVYKPTSQFQYSPVRKTWYCGDTLTTIFQGRQIIRKDDADSLITIQFSNNGMDW